MQPDFELLETEAKNVFATTGEKEREETRAFQSASLRSLARAYETDRETYGT